MPVYASCTQRLIHGVMSGDRCFMMLCSNLEDFALYTGFSSALISMPVSCRSSCQQFLCFWTAVTQLSATLAPFASDSDSAVEFVVNCTFCLSTSYLSILHACGIVSVFWCDQDAFTLSFCSVYTVALLAVLI